MTELLNVEHLSVQVQTKTLLNGIDLTVSTGELVGIIGPNGAGKSTLLKTLVGIHNKKSGSIRFEGQDAESLSALERAKRLSYMAQQQTAAFSFRVSETISLGAYSRAENTLRQQRVLLDQGYKIAQQLDIESLWDRKLDQLSGGETQLVHFARILMQDAPLMLLDEPTASLDIGHETQLMNLLKAQCRSGKTALVAIHNLNVAAAFCDRLILINNGQIVSQGRPENVITQHRMAAIYDQSVLVSRHPLTGSVTVLPNNEATPSRSEHIHIIGGAGSSVALARSLIQLGYRLSAGIGHEQDSDADYWQAIGLNHKTVPAFSSIDLEAIEKARPYVESADLTIMTEFPIGDMNSGNLELAKHAKQLWILEEQTSTKDRIYNEAHQADFEMLKSKARVLTTQQALDALKAN